MSGHAVLIISPEASGIGLPANQAEMISVTASLGHLNVADRLVVGDHAVDGVHRDEAGLLGGL